MAFRFKPAVSPLARLKAGYIEKMSAALATPIVDLSPRDLGSGNDLASEPSGEISDNVLTFCGTSDETPANEPASYWHQGPTDSATKRAAQILLSEHTGSVDAGGPKLVDTPEQLEELAVGQVAMVALHLIGDNRNNARFFYLATEIDLIALSMQKNSQLSIATGWVEDGKLLLNDGQKRARSARAGGLPYLKVETIARPDSRDGYLRSRAMNTERSDQTSLDDAVRWQQLLAEGVFKDQADLATSLDLSVSSISKTLAINAIPIRILHRMKESAITSSLRSAYELSRIFVAPDPKLDDEKANRIAGEVIDQILKRSLSADATKSLIASKIEGPRRRNRSELLAVRFGDRKGQLKVAHDKTALDLSFRDLTAVECDRLQSAIQGAMVVSRRMV